MVKRLLAPMHYLGKEENEPQLIYSDRFWIALAAVACMLIIFGATP